MHFEILQAGRKALVDQLLKPEPVTLTATLRDQFTDQYRASVTAKKTAKGFDLSFEIPTDVGGFFIDSVIFEVKKNGVHYSAAKQSLPRFFKAKSKQAQVLKASVDFAVGESLESRYQDDLVDLEEVRYQDTSVYVDVREAHERALEYTPKRLKRHAQDLDAALDQSLEKERLAAAASLDEAWRNSVLKKTREALAHSAASIAQMAISANNRVYSYATQKIVHVRDWRAIGANICPVGAILSYPSFSPPYGWLPCHGQRFSADDFPELAKLLPSLKLPNLLDQVLKGVTSDREILSLEKDQVKRHTHAAETAEAELTVETQSAGAHTHSVRDWGYKTVGSSWRANVPTHSNRVELDFKGYSSTSAGAHTHTIHVGQHSHNVVIRETGYKDAENTIRTIGTNWIIRAL